ncbi:unnamed protein product, partial [Anisakis simplex]|uniref:Sprouty-related, EVH1 domain-containing protein 3 n=1 Tax=Anisakis simplex TaxID=6269 RepID=A0A0M3KFC4_ANISI
PFDVDGVRSFIEAHSSLYKNGEHIVLPKKKEPSSEMMRHKLNLLSGVSDVKKTTIDIPTTFESFQPESELRDEALVPVVIRMKAFKENILHREAPDPVELTIRRLTCYSVAQGVIYHCCRNDDETAANMGRYGHGYNVCSCAPSNLSRKKRLKRWILLALLSLLIPCLCCYVPAHYAYGCCCKAKRGRHKPCLNPNERDYLLARRRTSRAMSRLSF